MNRITIYPYKIGSKSARNLANSLSSREGITAFRVRSSSPLKRRDNRIILNWGNASPPDFPVVGHLLNHFDDVNVAGNKLLTFQELQDSNIPIPEWTTDKIEAKKWLREGSTVLERHNLRGHSGEGIQVVGPSDEGEVDDYYLEDTPLYVKYKKKKHEFRVHVFDGKVIDIQQKKRESGVIRDDEQQKIRNRANGWVFCREDLDLINDIEYSVRIGDLAIQAVETLCLDFGAVDIIYNEREDQFYVLEVNTAPGLEGTTLENYTNAILNYIHLKQL